MALATKHDKNRPPIDYDTLKQLLSSQPTDAHSHTSGILATSRVSETFSGWTATPKTAPVSGEPTIRRHQSASRRFPTRESLMSAAGWRKEKPFQFCHHSDVSHHIAEYRREHSVGQSVRHPTVHEANRNVSRLQLHFSKCDKCADQPAAGPPPPPSPPSLCEHQQKDFRVQQPAAVKPFSNDLTPGALKPHLKPKTSIPGLLPYPASPTARARMEREALMASKAAEISSSVICVSGLGPRGDASALGAPKQRRMPGMGMRHLQKRIARARLLRHQDEMVEDMAESVADLHVQAGSSATTSTRSIGSNASNKKVSFVGITRIHQELSLKPSSRESERQGSVETRVRLSRPKPAMPHLAYRLNQPDHAKKEAKIGEIARQSTLVTPLLSKPKPPDDKYLRSSSSIGIGEKKQKLAFIDCRQTPNPVEGVRKQLNSFRRVAVPLRLPSRGGGWRGSRSPGFRRSPSPDKRSLSRTPSMDCSDLNALLDIQAASRLEKKVSVDKHLMAVGST
eukprot:m.54500 g.54500  ORF g.54500 m.54500 type:complete len:509 (+) comp34375_c0_seq3:212-1738(+)